MTAETYLEQLREELSVMERNIARVRRKLEAAAPEAQAATLHELATLETLHDRMASKIEAARQDNAENWSKMKEGFRKDIDGLAETLEKLILKYS